VALGFRKRREPWSIRTRLQNGFSPARAPTSGWVFVANVIFSPGACVCEILHTASKTKMVITCLCATRDRKHGFLTPLTVDRQAAGSNPARRANLFFLNELNRVRLFGSPPNGVPPPARVHFTFSGTQPSGTRRRAGFRGAGSEKIDRTSI